MAEFLSNDPFRPLLSLSNQKSLALTDKLVEKKSALEPSTLLTDPGGEAARERLKNPAEESNLIDIAQSSIFQGNERIFDAIHGRSRPDPEIEELGDFIRGVTPEARQRLVTGPTEEVMTSLAEGRHLDALIGSVKAAPGVLASSANVVPEAVLGAIATALVPFAGGAIFGKKIKKGVDTVKAVGKKVKQVRTRAELVKAAVKTLPKTAGQMSVVTADITQSQIAEIEQNGERPSAGKIAQMYLINMATVTAEGGIIKNLFVPKFKKEFIKEAGIVIKNMGRGSNFAQMGKRIGSGMKKALIAGGAEAAQEYAQTWAEIINVNVGENENFIEGLKRELSNADNQLQAKGGAFLGFGAGGLARASISAPAVAVGTAADLTKATAKGVVKTAVGTTKFVGRQVGKVADAAAFKVLSAEERAVILSEHNTRKELTRVKVSQFESIIEKVKSTKNIKELRSKNLLGPNASENDVATLAAAISKNVNDRELTDTDLESKSVLNSVKADVISAYRGDIGLLEVELKTRTGANIAERAGKNIGVASVDAAVAVIAAVDPGVKAVIAGLGEVSEKTITAVRELRSSTARGMIELAATAGKEEIKLIFSAAKSLSLDDLKRTTNVIKEMGKKEIDIGLEKIVRTKEKHLERAGIKSKEIINEKTLDGAIKAAAEPEAVISGDDITGLSSSINNTLAGTIDDISSLEQTEKAVNLLENSKEFKDQTRGAMSRDNMVITRRKLKRARTRLELEQASEARSVGEKVVDKAASVVRTVKDTVGPVVESASETIKEELGEVKDKLETKAKERTEAKAKETYTIELIQELKGFEELSTRPKLTDKAIERVPALVKLMKDSGITSRADFVDFLERFPKFQDNVRLLKELDAHYESNISADEIADSVQSFLINTTESIKKAYNKLNQDPACNIP